MQNDPVPPGPASGGLPGVLRLTAALVILALAVVAILVVAGVVSREQLAESAVKIVLIGGILAAAAIGLGALVAGGRRGN